MGFDRIEIRRNGRTGCYDVPVPIAGTNRRRWVSTGARDIKRARETIAESGVDRLVMLANANALTEEAVSIVTCGRRVTCDEIARGWQDEMGLSWSPGTARTYLIDVNALLDRCDAHAKPLTTCTRERIARFVNEGGACRSRRLCRLAAIRSFFRYARSKNYILQNPAEVVFVYARELTIDQLEPRESFPLSEEEFRRIIEVASPFWKAVTSIAYWTGLRFSDCVSLEWASLEGDSLIVWTKKRGKRVALHLDDPLLGAGALRAVFASIPRVDQRYCFPVERAECEAGRRSKYPTAFANMLIRLGILYKSFHSTRHAAISRFAKAGKSLEEIGTLVAHADTETTKGYVHV